MSLVVNPPSLAQIHQHPHNNNTPRDPAASEERRGGRPHSHHSSSSGSIIPPITFEGRGQCRTLGAERLLGGGAPCRSIFIFPTLLLLLLFLPVNSAVPILAASSLPQSTLTHPIYKSLSRQNPSATSLLLFFSSIKSGRVTYSGFEGSVASGHFCMGHAIISYAPFFILIMPPV